IPVGMPPAVYPWRLRRCPLPGSAWRHCLDSADGQVSLGLRAPGVWPATISRAAPVLQPDGPRGDDLRIELVDDAVAVQVERRQRLGAGLQLTREFERIENIHLTVAVDVFEGEARPAVPLH